MKRTEAIYWLHRYLREEVGGRFTWRDDGLRKATYARQMVQELAQRIRRSPEPPIEVVRQFYDEMDDILCESERRLTWAFASTMESLAAELLRYLRSKEGGNAK